MERIQTLIVRHRQTARLLWVGLALGALALSGSAGDPFP